MRKLLFALIGVVICVSINAQVKKSDEFNYTISNPYQVVDGNKIYFSKGNEVLAIKIVRGGYVFQKFSGDKLNEVKRNKDEVIPDGFLLEGFKEFNGKFYMFYSIYDRPNVTEQLFVREVDFDNAKFKDLGKLLFSVKGKVSGAFTSTGFAFSFKVTDKFDFYTTFDDSKLIVQYRKVPEEKRDAYNKDVIGMHVFDGDMEEVWSDDVTMPYTEKKMNNIGYAVDKKGNGFILAEVYKDETTRRVDKEGNPNYDLELIRIDGDDRSITTSKIDLKNKFIIDLGFFEGNDDEIILAGYFGKDYRAGTDGIFMFKLDENGEVSDEVSYEIPVDVMSMYMSERAQARMEKRDEKRDVSIPNMVLREIVFSEDGSLTIIGEKYYVVTHYNAKTGTTTYTYHYDEILMTRVDGNGELAWMKKLPKRQSGGAGRGGMSYFLMTGKNSHYVLFLDNVKNMEIGINDYPAAHSDGRGGYLTGFKVDDETGELTKISIFNTLDVNEMRLYQFMTSRIVKLNENEFAVEFYKKKKEDVMVKVTLTE